MALIIGQSKSLEDSGRRKDVLSLPKKENFEKDVDSDESSVEEEEIKPTSLNASAHDDRSLAARNTTLAAALSQKTEQLKRMGIMLEALSPIPGVSAERLLNTLDGSSGDMRDQKIVQLAKKTRHLSVALERERESAKQLRDRLSKHTTSLQAEKESTQVEVSPTAAQRRRVTKEHRPPNRKDIEDHVAKATTDLRAQLQKAKDEAAQLRRSLTKEIGETADVAHQKGWKGRAQQIVILKARVRELESQAQQQTRRYDHVDDRAREDLAHMERERQKAVEDITSSHAQLSDQLKEARRKLEAAKARNETLTKENNACKDHVRTLLDKSDTDNQLVDALRRELNALRQEVSNLKSRGDQKIHQGAVEVDLTRLRRDNARLELALERKSLEMNALKAATSQHQQLNGGPSSAAAPSHQEGYSFQNQHQHHYQHPPQDLTKRPPAHTNHNAYQQQQHQYHQQQPRQHHHPERSGHHRHHPPSFSPPSAAPYP